MRLDELRYRLAGSCRVGAFNLCGASGTSIRAAAPITTGMILMSRNHHYGAENEINTCLVSGIWSLISNLLLHMC